MSHRRCSFIKEKDYFIIIILLFVIAGIFLRVYDLRSTPPPFYYDEGMPLANAIWEGNYGNKSIPEKIYWLCTKPGILFLILTSYSSIDDVYFIFRFTNALIGILTMGLLCILSYKTIKNKFLLLSSIGAICVGTPILIHYSRLAVMDLGLPVYLIATLFLIFSTQRKNKNLFIFISGFLFGVSSLRFSLFLLAPVICLFIQSIKKRKINEFIIFCIALLIPAIFFSPYIAYSVPLIGQKLGNIFFPSYENFVNAKLKQATFQVSNILLYFHPDYLMFMGGRNIVSGNLFVPFSRIVCLAGVEVWNCGFGVLGFWAPFLFLGILLKPRLNFSYLLALSIFLIGLISFPLYPYDNPIATRPFIWYLMAPWMTAVFLDREKDPPKRIYLSFLVTILATSIIFPIYYFSFYSSDPATLASFFTAEHESFEIAKEQIQILKKDSQRVAVIYSFKNYYRNERINIKLIADFHLIFLKSKGIIKEYPIGITNNQYLSNPLSLKSVWDWILHKNSTLVIWIFEDLNKDELPKLLGGYGKILSIVDKEFVNSQLQWKDEIVEHITVVVLNINK
jgi:hypothetical protein